MRILAIFLFCAFASSGIHAQDFKYVHTISSGSGNDEDLSVVTDDDGNVFEVGYYADTTDLDPGPGTFYVSPVDPYGVGTYLVKKDSAGNFIWGKQLPYIHISTLYYKFPRYLIIAGWYANDSLDIDPGPSTTYLDSLSYGGSLTANGAGFIVEFDTSGNFQWASCLISHYGIDKAPPILHDIETDIGGNVYVTGYFYDSLDVDPGPGTFWLTSAVGPYSDMFILKLDFAGNFVWTRQITGGGQEIAYALNLTSTGDLLMAGGFILVTDFDPGPGTAISGTSTADENMFLLRLTASGDFISVKDFINDGEQSITDMELDAEGNIYFTGTAQGNVDFDPGTGTYILPAYGSSSGDVDVFVMKLDDNENFLWAKRFGPAPDNSKPVLDLDLMSNVYTTGRTYTSSVDLDPGPGIYLGSLSSSLGVETFIQKLSTEGDFVWARVWSTNSSENITVDNFYNIYLSGDFNDTVDFDPNAGTHIEVGEWDGYLLKLNQPPGIPTNTPDYTSQSMANVYPNPTTGNITVFTGEQMAQSILVTDVSGRMMYTIRPNSTQTTIDLSVLSSGVYFITSRINGSSHTVRIVKTDR